MDTVHEIGTRHYDTNVLAGANGSTTTVKDNRAKLDVDPKQIEVWEIETVQETEIKAWLFLFAHYLSDGNGRVSPEINKMPMDEMSNKDKAITRHSEAYKLIRRYSMEELKGAAESFATQAMAEIDPN